MKLVATHKKKLIALGIIAVLFSIYMFSCRWRSADSISYNGFAESKYVGDDKCKSCHLKQWNDWEHSDHFKAMLPANDSTVKGNFNNVFLNADGVSSRFFKRDSSFFINTEGPDGKNHDYRVLYTFGHYPLQQYLVEFPGGRMQVPRVTWNSKAKKWFHQYAGETISHKDWLHWTRDAQNWNTMCAGCHSTNLQKNYNINQDNYQTTFTNINVGCESCHGPGQFHIHYINNDYKAGKKVEGHYTHTLKDQAKQLTTCSPCHSVKSDISSQLITSGELLDNFIPQLPTTERFYSDGQIKEEDYIWASFMQSKMMRRGVTCNSCHNSHTGKILLSTNQLCLQCHNKTYDSPSHHFHQMNTLQADCKSCHMPGRVYMGNDLRHDHSFRVPRPDLSVEFGVPNACTGCHTNKSNEWAMEATNKWWGTTRKYHFSEDLIPGSKTDRNSEAHLLKLVNDTATASIVKATALFYLGSVLTESSMRSILKELQSADALLRYYALRSLANFSPEQWMESVAPLFSDKVRAVRIAAADLFTSIPSQQIPAQHARAFANANEELKQYLLYQADFADGNVLIADHYLKLEDYENAQKFYLRALKKDSLLNYARLNLSLTYNVLRKNSEALKMLKTAADISPGNDRIFYNLGLLNIEMKDTTAALKNFEKAVQLSSQNPRLYYNYGLLLHIKKHSKKATEILQKGLTISPSDHDLQIALRYVNAGKG
jgi:predicted CXXCH cytochrome family protein